MFEHELEVMIDAVNSVRELILDIYNSKDIGVEIKDDNSPVTKADKAADRLISMKLTAAFPLYSVFTEESFDDKKRLTNDYVFIVDPVDGTKEFVAKNDQFTVNIGLSYKHEAVVGVILVPVTGEIYYGIKGYGSFYLKDKDAKPLKINVNNKTNNLTVLISRFHSNAQEESYINKHSNKISFRKTVGASLKGCEIARGNAELSYRCNPNTKEWDTCAMQVIVEQAGGMLVKFDGTPLRYNREDVYNRDGYIIVNKKENILI